MCLQRENPASWGLGQGGQSPGTVPLSFGAPSFERPRCQSWTHGLGPEEAPHQHLDTQGGRHPDNY